MRDLNRSSTCIPKCDDRRRPPYLRRSRSAAPIRRSSDGQLMFFLSCSTRSSGCEISFYILYVSLSAKIGDGRHICSRREQRGPYSPIERPPVSCLMEYRKRREAKGRPISTRRGEAAPYLASRASGAAIKLLSC